MSNQKTEHVEQLSGLFYGEMTQLDLEDYHLSHYSLLDKEELHRTPPNSNEGLTSEVLTVL